MGETSKVQFRNGIKWNGTLRNKNGEFQRELCELERFYIEGLKWTPSQGQFFS